MKKWLIPLVLGIGVLEGAPPTPDKPAPVTLGRVEAWMKTWQRRLSLEDWRITPLIVHPSDLKPHTLGHLRWDSHSKEATLLVLDPADYALPAAEIAIDMEFTVVHELVHLQLAPLPRDPAARGVEEQVVNNITEALLRLEKGPVYRPRPVAFQSVK